MCFYLCRYEEIICKCIFPVLTKGVARSFGKYHERDYAFARSIKESTFSQTSNWMVCHTASDNLLVPVI